MNSASKLLLIFCCGIFSACSTPPASRPVVYMDVKSAGQVTGVGIESQDIGSVTDSMVRDLLANQSLMQHATAPRIIMDVEHFKNESSQPINKGLLVTKLKNDLQRAAQGRLLFVSRASTAMVVQERELKRDGVTDSGTTGLTQALAGADYRLIGVINTLDARSKSTGTVERYTQISFELIDLESGISIWSNLYDFKKGGLDDAIYR